ncbi:transporter [Herbiconiux sp. KACC 21604]|uniref:transporter n=1 Tax=unclassified Herbiconiux TaxID=2618217 RepID=UPI0014913D94|nr:transporter [Herbiconiux sp. SALV-R1]QJU54180.1 transporter [Herbiconiux sp. SALV-R1]WPO85233.1 transporter [Herbiconiux sp. KACC 21604]
MVASLVKLRFLVLRNSFKRSPWQLVAVIIGGLYGLGVLFGALAGLFFLNFAPVELISTVLVLAGSALVLGWIVVPLVAFGVEQTLDPARLVVFPLSMKQLLVGLTLAGVLGVPGMVTGIVAVATFLPWITHAPLAAIVAVPAGLLGLLICVVGSRTVAALSSSLQSNRRFRELGGVLIFIPIILIGPIIVGLTRGLASSADALPELARGLAWSPLGAAWAVPVDVAANDWLAAVAKLLIALATLALLVVIWRRALAVALVTPPASASRRVARGKTGLFQLFPATPTGAVAARCLTYWRRDPRYARQLIVVPLVPVFLWFYGANMGNPVLLNLCGPLIAFFLSLALYTDISYDGTAFATHLADGVKGSADRVGRLLAVSVIAVPVVLVATLVTAGVTSSWASLPMLLGLDAAALLGGFAVVSVSSALIVVPVPQAGDNPFKSAPGAGFTTMLSGFATWGVSLALLLPAVVLAVLSLVLSSELFGWLTLAVGVVLGAVFLAIGLRVGGRLLDQRGPALLARLKMLRSA